MTEKKKVCSRRKSIVAENYRRLREMHPQTPKIDDKTMSVEGLILICEEPTFVVGRESDEVYLCDRCKAAVGGSFESQGRKVSRLK